jgi:transposase
VIEISPKAGELGVELPRDRSRYWEVMHGRAVERIEREQEKHAHQVEALRGKLKSAHEEIERLSKRNSELRALVKLRAKQAFGKKSERKRGRTGRAPTKGGGPWIGHGRRKQGHLPVVEERNDLSVEQQLCTSCGRARKNLGDNCADFIEIKVEGHVRRVRSAQYAKTCRCPGEASIVSAPAPTRLLPRNELGVSVWTLVLMDKFFFQRPTHRLLEELAAYDISLARSTLTEGMKRLAPVFEPLVDGILERVRAARLRQADETGWPVFAEVEGKKGHRWQLWVFLCKAAVYFKVAPTRSSLVVQEVLGSAAEGILVVDRFSAYKAFAALSGGKLRLAFCWSHVRRDYLTISQTRPSCAPWAEAWVKRIDRLWELNDRRRESGGDLAKEEAAVRAQLEVMYQESANQLLGDKLHAVQQKALKSLRRHWGGLTLFAEQPEIPMDNNGSEREVRGPSLGRKSYYGSRAKWSAELSALLFSIFHTLARHEINPRLWLTSYLQACAENGGRAPAEAIQWLPWNLSAERRSAFAIERRVDEHDPQAPNAPEPKILWSGFQPRRTGLDPAVAAA